MVTLRLKLSILAKYDLIATDFKKEVKKKGTVLTLIKPLRALIVLELEITNIQLVFCTENIF